MSRVFDTQVAVRLPAELYEALSAEAVRLDRPVAWVIRRMLSRAVAGEVVAGAPTREDGGPSALRGSVSTRVSTLPPSRPEPARREVTPNLKRQP